MTGIEFLRCNASNLTSIDISGLQNLKTIYITNNPIQSVDLTVAPNLEQARVYGNEITALNVSGLVHLKLLHCYGNELQQIDLSGLNALETLHITQNHLLDIDVSGLSSLQSMYCFDNNLSHLNVNGLTNLTRLNCSLNNLEYVLFKDNGFTGAETDILAFGDNPNIQYVCTNEAKIPAVQTIADSYGYTQCQVISNCSLGMADSAVQKLRLAPNPVNTLVTISGILDSPLEATIYNHLGQIVRRQIAPQHTIDVEYLPAGQYFMKVTQGERSETLKFVKD